ncbi:glycosyltransferase family 2 protein [Antribacter gilvus]|uniref:glycosyltransferase family 2 protein n=1 Tax=Antribacter gilvus TaxID=2304675 RepID=UPI000F778F76|nr:glycosyltransferase family 2 protein [Antribacter gilvus]
MSAGLGSGPGPSPELSIVVVTYHSADWIGRCLGAVPTALGGRQAEVVVVDNASTDGTADLVARDHPDVTLVRNVVNTGFAAAVNAGVAASSAPWVVLLNPDTISRPGALANLLAFAEARPGHGLYGGRTLTETGEVEPSSCWALPTVWSTACFALGLSTLFPRTRLFDPESMGRWPRDSVREVGMVTGCLLLVPRPVWDELGGLDERYFVYGEDADLGARARAAGYRPVITPDAEVVHAIGQSSSGDGGSLPLVLAGKVTYARTHFPGLSGAVVVGLLRLGVGVRAAGARVSGRGRKWAVGWRRRNEWWHGFPIGEST